MVMSSPFVLAAFQQWECRSLLWWAGCSLECSSVANFKLGGERRYATYQLSVHGPTASAGAWLRAEESEIGCVWLEKDSTSIFLPYTLYFSQVVFLCTTLFMCVLVRLFELLFIVIT